MDENDRLNLIKSVGKECVGEDELSELVKSGKEILAYDGFEPSGRMHIAQGLLKALYVNRLTSCGVRFIFLVADWFALLNNKLDGDLSKIRLVGEYMIEIWKAVGMNMDAVEFKWSSEVIRENHDEYWMLVFDIARRFSLKRTLRCTKIMGRSESDNLSTSQVLYPVMQCADIFQLGVDICQLGDDQRKVNMLAREYCDISPIKRKRPVILSHHMLLGLGGQEKMSKSDPDSAIFMEDTEEDVYRKIKKAYCPVGCIESNPIMEYYKHIVFQFYPEVEIFRKEKDGGNKVYNRFCELESDFASSLLHPLDLKQNLSQYLNKLLEPVRKHFRDDKKAKDLLSTVISFSK